MDKEELKAVYRHSMAHILAKAVIEIFGKDRILRTAFIMISCFRGV